MKITIEQKEPCLIDLHIELPPEHVEKEWKHVVNEYAKFAEIPGFRKGKAPRSSIEKKYARDIQHDVIEELIEYSIKKAFEKEDIDFLEDPIIKEKLLREDHSFYLVVTVITHPKLEFETSDYLNLEVKIEAENYDPEKMMQSFLEFTQHELAEGIEVEDRGLIMGDLAFIDYDWDTDGSEYLDALEDDSTIDEGLVSNYEEWYELEENEYIPGFSEALLGMKPDEERKFKITFPDNFREKKLRGITVFYEVTLFAINIKNIPPIDDNLAHEVMPGHNLEELKQVVSDYLKESYEKFIESKAQEAIKEKILENIPCPVPLALAQKFKEHSLYDLIRISQEDGLSSKEIQVELEDFEQTTEEYFAKELQWTFITQAIATKESLELTNNETLDIVKQFAEERNMTLEEFAQKVDFKEYAPVFYGRAMEKKVLDFIYSQTQITKVPAALKDFEK